MRGKWNIMPATEQWAVRQFTDSNIFSVRTAARYIAAGIAQVSEAAPINGYRCASLLAHAECNSGTAIK